MFARGAVVLNTHPHAILVPRDAVLDNTGTTGRVFLVKGKTAKEQQVKLGYANMQDVEITSGVQAGDQARLKFSWKHQACRTIRHLQISRDEGKMPSSRLH